MIAKISLGNSFSATVSYIMDEKKNAELLDSDGVRTKDTQSIIDSFTMQQKMKPTIMKPVYHISLDFSAQDSEKLTNEFMKNVAGEYLQKMNIKNAQYIVVRHYDKEHPHIHLCINRIDNDGKLISNRNDRYRSERICKELTEKHGLHFASDKKQVKRNRLRGSDKVKYEIYDTLKELIPQVNNWQELSERLDEQGIHVRFKQKGGTTGIQGVIFSKGNYSFNGSKIDRECSYSKITQRLKTNNQAICIRDNPRYNQTWEQKSTFESQKTPSIPSFNNIYSEEDNTSNNRKRKRRL
jgi:hypothetical protein